ncbi:glycerate kinase 2 [Corchorus olitorius]|uniref:Glycerate kinase 2 n=1 Tax=Corchorus olitorius TaxID=93759 RepID=A0A1R3GPW0_9ROSI|nr:glycerate kinase 2 [Corchorus olitorius]
MAKQHSINGITPELLKRIDRKGKEEHQAHVLDEDMDIDVSVPNQFPSN